MNIEPLPPGTALSAGGASATAATSYVIRRVLGMGGFGITYLAEWLGSEVAIKEYLPEDFAGRASDGLGVVPRTGKSAELFQFGLERFEEEARTLLQLKDAPSIAKALNYFEANATAYLVMDYVAGPTLEQHVREHGALPEAELRQLLRASLQSLAVIHERGYLHRDIKPSNLIVLPGARPLLIDFGAARAALGAKTQMLTVMLSPGYAPFEQYNTSGSGPFTDLYSLGATLYYSLLNGDRKQVALTMSRAQAPDRVAALQRGEPDPLTPATQLGAGRYSRQLLEVLDWMLRIWPSERPPSAAEVMARLESESEPRSADRAAMPPTQVSPRAHATRVPASNSQRLWLTAGAALMVLVLSVVSMNRRKQPASVTVEAQSAPLAASREAASDASSTTAAAPVEGQPTAVTASAPPAATNRARGARAGALPVVELPTASETLDSAQLQVQLVRYDLFDRRRNPTGKGVSHRYRQQVSGAAVVISDAATGLMWQKQPSDTDQYTFRETQGYVDELNRARFAGYDDWRLPTTAEAASLLEPQPVSDKYLDPLFTGGNFIWTANSAAAERAWVIYFYDGYAATEPFSFNASVRAVRSL